MSLSDAAVTPGIAHAAQQVIVIERRRGEVLEASRGIDAELGETLGLETKVGIEHVHEAAQQQRRCDDEDERQRDFADDERGSDARVAFCRGWRRACRP